MTNLQLKITDPIKQISSVQTVSHNYSDAQKTKIANAAKEFEGLLTSMMLKSMTKTTDGMFGSSSFGGDDFNMIFMNEIASYISEKKDLGIADILYKKITGENLNVKPKPQELQPLKPELKPEAKTGLKSSGTGMVPSIEPSSLAMERLTRYNNIINEASDTFGVNKNLIKSVILTESAAKENAVSGANAKGLMQLIDSTASEMGVKNVWNPKQNIFGGTKYLAEMLRKYNGNLDLALASYNAGPQNVDKYGGIPPFEETQNYVKRVLGYLNHLTGGNNGTERSI